MRWSVLLDCVRRRRGDRAKVAPGWLEGGVLLTIHRFSQGGADRVTILLANGLVAAGIPTAILLFRSGGEAEPLLIEMLDTRVFLITAGVPLGSRHLELVRGFRRLRREVMWARPATVLASSSNMGLVTSLVARTLGRDRPAFAMKLTNPVIRPRDAGPIRRLYRHVLYGFVFGGFDRVMILTDSERAWLSQRYPSLLRRFRTVANPYVTTNMRHRERPAERGRRILTAARMMPQKRLDRLISAMALIVDPTVTLTIVGDGPGRPALERQIATLGLRDRVHLPGFVADILPWFDRADVFALSSDYEGLPAVILEALACDLPVVTTDCFFGARDMLTDADGCAVVARDDTPAFARALEASLGCASRRTLRDIAQPYDMDVAITRHIEALCAGRIRDRLL